MMMMMIIIIIDGKLMMEPIHPRDIIMHEARRYIIYKSNCKLYYIPLPWGGYTHTHTHTHTSYVQKSIVNTIVPPSIIYILVLQ